MFDDFDMLDEFWRYRHAELKNYRHETANDPESLRLLEKERRARRKDVRKGCLLNLLYLPVVPVWLAAIVIMFTLLFADEIVMASFKLFGLHRAADRFDDMIQSFMEPLFSVATWLPFRRFIPDSIERARKRHERSVR